MSITYAGVSLPQSTPEAAAWIEANIDPRDVYDWSRLSWPGPRQAHLNWGGEIPTRPIRIGSLWWPRDASRWAVAHFLVGSVALKAIEIKCFHNGAPIGPMPLILDDERPHHSVTASMWMLPARPLSTVGDPKFDDLYLLTLVDERYWYWFPTNPGTLTVLPGRSTWAQLFAGIGGVLDPTLPFTLETPIPGAYLHPSQVLSSEFEYAPLLLDTLAYNIGQRVVRDLNGGMRLEKPLTAAAVVRAQRYKWEVLGGGDFRMLARGDLPMRVPNTVLVTYPAVACDDPPYVSTVLLPGLPRDLVPDYVGIRGMNQVKVFHDTAIYDGTNQTQLDDLTQQIAVDWYNFQVARVDIKYDGICPWIPEALHDGIEWRLLDGDVTTRISPSAWDDLAEELHHNGSAGSQFCGGSAVKCCGCPEWVMLTSQAGGYYSWVDVDYTEHSSQAGILTDASTYAAGVAITYLSNPSLGSTAATAAAFALLFSYAPDAAAIATQAAAAGAAYASAASPDPGAVAAGAAYTSAAQSFLDTSPSVGDFEHVGVTNALPMYLDDPQGLPPIPTGTSVALGLGAAAAILDLSNMALGPAAAAAALAAGSAAFTTLSPNGIAATVSAATAAYSTSITGAGGDPGLAAALLDYNVAATASFVSNTAPGDMVLLWKDCDGQYRFFTPLRPISVGTYDSTNLGAGTTVVATPVKLAAFDSHQGFTVSAATAGADAAVSIQDAGHTQVGVVSLAAQVLGAGTKSLWDGGYVKNLSGDSSLIVDTVGQTYPWQTFVVGDNGRPGSANPSVWIGGDSVELTQGGCIAWPHTSDFSLCDVNVSTGAPDTSSPYLSVPGILGTTVSGWWHGSWMSSSPSYLNDPAFSSGNSYAVTTWDEANLRWRLSFETSGGGSYGPVEANQTNTEFQIPGSWHYAVGSATGIPATIALAKLTPGGSDGSITVVGGIVTAYTAPT